MRRRAAGHRLPDLLLAVEVVQIGEATSFLDDRYAGRAQEVAELGGGDWSRAYSFRLDGRALVARFGPWGEDFVKDEQAMRYAGPDLPVPEVLEVGDAPGGGAYAISQRHFGSFLESLDGPRFRRLLPALLRTLDALRSLPAPDGSKAPSWRSWLLAGLEDRPGGRVSGWRATLAGSEELDRLFTAGEDAVSGLLDACPETAHVLHLDLLNRNVLVDEAGTRLEAVFDWGCSTAGDYLYEVAWFTFWAPWHAGLAAVDLRTRMVEHYAVVGLGVPDFDERLLCYEIHIGLTHLAYWVFADRPTDLSAVADRLRGILDQCRVQR